MSFSATLRACAAAAGILCFGTAVANAESLKSIIIVHGAFADAGGWQTVYKLLRDDGYRVTLAEPPMTSFDADVSAARTVIDRAQGKVLLVGHSYGGQIITQAGDDPKVAGLFYVAAVQPNVGESMLSLLSTVPEPTNDLVEDGNGFLTIEPDRFVADFAADAPPSLAEFQAAAQMPVAKVALGTTVTAAAWRAKPSWSVVATQDREISPDLERYMASRAKSTTFMLRSSHAAYEAHPYQIAYLIELAAQRLSH